MHEVQFSVIDIFRAMKNRHWTYRNIKYAQHLNTAGITANIYMEYVRSHVHTNERPIRWLSTTQKWRSMKTFWMNDKKIRTKKWLIYFLRFTQVDNVNDETTKIRNFDGHTFWSVNRQQNSSNHWKKLNKILWERSTTRTHTLSHVDNNV